LSATLDPPWKSDEERSMSRLPRAPRFLTAAALLAGLAGAVVLGGTQGCDCGDATSSRRAAPENGLAARRVGARRPARVAGERRRGCQPERMLEACHGGDPYECELGRLLHGKADLATMAGLLKDQPRDMEALLRALFPAIGGKPIADRPIPIPPGAVFAHKGFAPYPLPSRVDWLADPFRNNSWRLRFQSLDWFFPYIRGDAAALDTGAAILADWVRQMLFTTPTNNLTWTDHAVSMRLDRAAQLTERYIADHAVLNRRYLVAAAQLIVTHLYVLAAGCCYAQGHNHGVLHDLAILTWVKRYPALRDGPRMLELATRRLLEQQVRPSVTSDGVHVENSPCYHVFYVGLLNRAIRIAMDAGEKPPADIVHARDSMFEPLVQALQPDQTLAQFGDCNDARQSRRLRELVKDTRALGVGDPAALAPLEWVLSGGKSGVAPALDRVYEIGGYASFRDRWDPATGTGTTVHFKTSHLSRVHYHADETAFEVFAYGRTLIVEPGAFSYDSKDPLFDYQRSPSAQNVLVVDDDDRLEQPARPTSRVVAHGVDGKTVWVQGTHVRYARLGVSSLVRTLAFAKPDTIIVIDHVKAAGQHRYAQHFHLSPDLSHVQLASDRAVVASMDGGPSVAIAAAQPATIETPRGVADGAVRKGWHFPDYLVKKPAYDVVMRHAGSEIDLPVLIVLSAPGHAARIPADIAYREEGQLATLSWRLDGIEHTLSVPRH